jgi:hypothetical protein
LQDRRKDGTYNLRDKSGNEFTVRQWEGVQKSIPETDEKHLRKIDCRKKKTYCGQSKGTSIRKWNGPSIPGRQNQQTFCWYYTEKENEKTTIKRGANEPSLRPLF